MLVQGFGFILGTELHHPPEARNALEMRRIKLARSTTDYCRAVINNPPHFKRLNIRIPMIIPIQGRRFINPGPTFMGTLKFGHMLGPSGRPMPNVH